MDDQIELNEAIQSTLEKYRQGRRLSAIANLGLDALEPDERLERITRLLRHSFSAHSAALSFVDGDRVSRKSADGCELIELPSEDTVCAEAIKAQSIYVVEDLTQHAIFTELSCVKGQPAIRAYAAAVLRDRQGMAFGTLCIFDTRPRTFDEEELELLRTWGDLVEDELMPSIAVSQKRTVSQMNAAQDPLTSFLTFHEYRIKSADLFSDALTQGGKLDRISMKVRNLHEFNAHDRVLSGDAVLLEVAQRFHNVLNGEDFIVSRLRGNMLGATLSDCKDIGRLVSTLQQELEKPIATAFGDVIVSIHVVVVPNIQTFDRLKDVSAVIAKLYDWPTQGSGTCVTVFDRDEMPELTRSVDIARRLPIAMEQQEIEMHYQPKVRAESGEIVGVEALIRWTDDRLGVIPPDELLAAAEDFGLSEDLDVFVLERVLGDVSHWRNAKVPVVPVSVNISSEHLEKPEFPKLVISKLSEYDVDPSLLEIEIVENIAVRDMTAVIANMQNLRDSGIRFSIDDFGTGYSSLSYLMELPLDTLKIDRAFIQKVMDNPKAASLAQAIVTIGHRGGMTVIAEGVEDLSQFLIIRSHRCDMIQGFLFSKPLPFSELMGQLNKSDVFNPELMKRLRS